MENEQREEPRTAKSPLEITGEGTLLDGKMFTRVANPLTKDCIEYQVGKAVLDAGYEHGIRVRYKVIIEPIEPVKT